MTYTIDIAGLKRDLPLCPVTEDLYIGAFVLFGEDDADQLARRFEHVGFDEHAVLPPRRIGDLVFVHGASSCSEGDPPGIISVSSRARSRADAR